MREHTKKPISRAEAKKAVLKERSDAGGKIMKALLVHANEKLLALCGLELVPEGGAANGAGEECDAAIVERLPNYIYLD